MTIRTEVLQRALIVLVGCLLLGSACGARALATTEYCPAHAGAFHPIDGPGPATLYAFALNAQSARSVQGTVLIATSGGWYRMKFPLTPLVARTYSYSGKFGDLSRNAFDSDAIYVRFPSPVDISTAYVSGAQTSGERDFGWDSKGDFACLPQSGFFDEKPRNFSGLVLSNPRTDLTTPPRNPAAIITAESVPAPGDTSCPEPFTNPAVKRAVSPDYPRSERTRRTHGLSIVEVALNAAGTVTDAWTFLSSGSAAFDGAALQSAESSTFTPGLAFCKPTGGLYLFNAEFEP
ncbi:MAG: TonB family protein [Candidatus Aquilonibacter sp.]